MMASARYTINGTRTCVENQRSIACIASTFLYSPSPTGKCGISLPLLILAVQALYDDAPADGSNFRIVRVDSKCHKVIP